MLHIGPSVLRFDRDRLEPALRAGTVHATEVHGRTLLIADSTGATGPACPQYPESSLALANGRRITDTPYYKIHAMPICTRGTRVESWRVFAEISEPENGGYRSIPIFIETFDSAAVPPTEEAVRGAFTRARAAIDAHPESVLETCERIGRLNFEHRGVPVCALPCSYTPDTVKWTHQGAFETYATRQAVINAVDVYVETMALPAMTVAEAEVGDRVRIKHPDMMWEAVCVEGRRGGMTAVRRVDGVLWLYRGNERTAYFGRQETTPDELFDRAIRTEQAFATGNEDQVNDAKLEGRSPLFL